MQHKINKAKTLLEALPYIQKFHGKTIVIKYGGSLMLNDTIKPLFASDILLLKYVGMNPVIVHGGGKEISKWMKRMGKESQFIDGLRVTDAETMEITEMVLSGKINSEVVSLINQAGGKAVGLSGKDADLFRAQKRRSQTNQDLGLVGDITESDVSLVTSLCEKDYIPVISSVGTGPHGESLNINADEVAEEMAKALGALKLIFLTDVEGILIEGTCCSHLNLTEAKALRGHPDIQGGMLPKLMSCIESIENGVSDVHIINGNIEHSLLLELFTDVGIGTMISNTQRKSV